MRFPNAIIVGPRKTWQQVVERIKQAIPYRRPVLVRRARQIEEASFRAACGLIETDGISLGSATRVMLSLVMVVV